MNLPRAKRRTAANRTWIVKRTTQDITISEDFTHVLKDGVVNALKDALLEGRLRPREAIVERDIAQQMKVGTPVVREALISREGQGSVRRVLNTGTSVTEFNCDEMQQRYRLRVELESQAIHWARERVTPADLAE